MLMKNIFCCQTTEERLTLMLLLHTKKSGITAICNDLPGKRQSQFCLKSQCGSCNCALPLFLPAPVSVMGGVLYFTQPDLVTNDFGEGKLSCIFSPIPTPVLAVRTWKGLMPAFLLMLQPRLQVCVSGEFYITPDISDDLIFSDNWCP